jgi:shikimate kinase
VGEGSFQKTADPGKTKPAGAPIFLVGFMASGKSTVGRLVAARLGWQFRDLDRAIADAAGQTIPDIFASEGEEGFRRRETEAVREAAGLRRVVIATGGGAACREENLAQMLAAGHVIALAVSPEEVVRRTAGRTARPLLDGVADPLATAIALLGAREPFYSRAHARIETQNRTPDEVAVAVLRVLEATPT